MPRRRIIKTIIVKPRPDRVEETVAIWRKLMDLGCIPEWEGIIQLKKCIDGYIATGDPVTTTICVPEMERKIHLILPRRKHNICSCTLVAMN